MVSVTLVQIIITHRYYCPSLIGEETEAGGQLRSTGRKEGAGQALNPSMLPWGFLSGPE